VGWRELQGISFRDPQAFWLLVPLALVAWWVRRRRRPATVPLPVLGLLSLPRTLRVRARALLPVLRGLALVALVVAVARPRLGEERSVLRREGIAIQMVLDRSGSMEKEMRYGDERLPRIEVVKRIFEAFVRGGGPLKGRPTDLVGLTTFARFPVESCPLVTLHEPLLVAVRNLRTVAPFLTQVRTPTRDQAEARFRNPLNQTAIGDALQQAVLSIVAAEADLRRERKKKGDGGYELKGKVAILLTDGENNAGQDPLEAASVAKANGVRVYPVLLASREVTRETLFGKRVVQRVSQEDLDRAMAVPREIAKRTGGKAFLATSGDDLLGVYEAIDRLERSEVGAIAYTSFHELFSWPLGIGLLLAWLAEILAATWLRVAP